jgi:hypothetical protein
MKNDKIRKFENCIAFMPNADTFAKAFLISVTIAHECGFVNVKLIGNDAFIFQANNINYNSSKISKSAFRAFLARCYVLLKPVAEFVDRPSLYGCSARFDAAKLDVGLNGEMKFEFENTTKEQWLKLESMK